MRRSEHLEFERQIDDYLLGRLSAEEAECFEKHYFDCPACFQRTAERAALLAAVRQAGPAPAPAVRPAKKRSRIRFRLAWSAAGAAVLLAAAVFLMVPRTPRPPDFPDSGTRIIRGAPVVLIAPVGILEENPKSFAWRGVGGAAEYRITVEGLEPVWTAETGETSAVIPAEIAARFLPGKTYSWTVKAYAAEGTLLAVSPAAAFSIGR